MAEPIVVNFLTGAVPGFDEPTICHSGKTKPNTCHAIAHEPGRAGWVLVRLPPGARRRDGWWCPDCARQLRQEMAKRGFWISSEDIPIAGPGTA